MDTAEKHEWVRSLRPILAKTGAWLDEKAASGEAYTPGEQEVIDKMKAQFAQLKEILSELADELT